MGLFLASPKIYRRSFLELGFKTLKKRLLPNCYSGFGAGDLGEMGLTAGGRGLYALHGDSFYYYYYFFAF